MNRTVLWMRRSVVFIFISLLMVSSVFAADSEKEKVAQRYYTWCSALNSAHGATAKVVGLYAPDAILLPTVSSGIYFNDHHGGVESYFANLTARKDFKCTPDRLITRIYNGIAINAGTYTFSYLDKADQRKTIHARFTFAYEKLNGQWMIVNHHSSVLPD